MHDDRLIHELRQLADIGIVNARRDADIIRKAADRLEELSERAAIQDEDKFASDANFMPQWVYVIRGNARTYPAEMLPVIISYQDSEYKTRSGTGWWDGHRWHNSIKALRVDDSVVSWCMIPNAPY